MKELPSRDDLLQQLSYCEKTGRFTRKSGKESVGFVTPCGYVTVGFNYKKYYAHRLAWKIFYNEDPEFIDHIDGNRQNNSIKNLRSVSRKQNQKNMKKPVNNTSGVAGVVFDKARRKWKAQIQVEGRMIFLGRFNQKDAAVTARQEAEEAYGFHKNHGR